MLYSYCCYRNVFVYDKNNKEKKIYEKNIAHHMVDMLPHVNIFVCWVGKFD